MENSTAAHSDKLLAKEVYIEQKGNSLLRFGILFFLLLMGTLTGSIAKLPDVNAFSAFEAVDQMEGSVTAVFVHQSTAYLGVGLKLVVVDVSNAANPVILNQSHTLPAVINDVDMVADFLYVTTRQTLEIFDISTPENPVHVNSLPSPNSDSGFGNMAFSYMQNYVFIASYAETPEFYALDIINRNEPVITAAYEGVSRHPSRLSVYGRYLYVANSYDIEIFDITTPYNPQKISTIPTGSSAMDVITRNEFAFIADYEYELLIVDISDPSNPIDVGYSDADNYATNILLVDQYAYLLEDSGLRIIDISNPYSPQEVHNMNGRNHRQYADMVISGSKLFQVDGYNTLNIFDITNPQTPKILGSLNLASPTTNPPSFLPSASLQVYLTHDNVLTLHDHATGVTQNLSPDKPVASFSLSPAGRQLLYATTSGESYLLTFKLDSDNALTYDTVPTERPVNPQTDTLLWSPNGSHVLVKQTEEAIPYFVLFPDGDTYALFDADSVQHVIGWSYDDQWLAYCLDNQKLFVWEVTHLPREIADNATCGAPDGGGGSQWSPTSLQLAFTTGNSPIDGPPQDERQLHLYDVDNGQKQMVSSGGVGAWSPDGAYLSVYNVNSVGATGHAFADVSLTNLDGSRVVELGEHDVSRGLSSLIWRNMPTGHLFGPYLVDMERQTAVFLADVLFDATEDGQTQLLGLSGGNGILTFACQQPLSPHPEPLMDIDFSSMEGVSAPGAFANISPDGKYAILHAFAGDPNSSGTWLFPCGAAPSRHLSGNAFVKEVGFSGNGRFFSFIDTDTLNILELENYANNPITTIPIMPGSPTGWLAAEGYEPSGREDNTVAEEKIAFTWNRDGNADIYLVGTDGEGLFRVTTHPDGDITPAWSPDGKRLAFVSGPDGNDNIYH